MIIFRLAISFRSVPGFSFGITDIKGAYMQRGPAIREIYVRLLKEWKL